MTWKQKKRVKMMSGNDQIDDYCYTVIYDNGMYQVVCGSAIASDHKELLYRVENKEHGVVEAETTILMRALYCADDYKAGVVMHGFDVDGRDGELSVMPEGTVLS